MRLNLSSPREILERPDLVIKALNELFAGIETLRRDLSEYRRDFEIAHRRQMGIEQNLTRLEERVREMERGQRSGPGGRGPGSGRGRPDRRRR